MDVSLSLVIASFLSSQFRKFLGSGSECFEDKRPTKIVPLPYHDARTHQLPSSVVIVVRRSVRARLP